MSRLDFDSSDFEKRMKIYGVKQEAVILKTLSEQAMDLRRKAAETTPKLWGVLEEGVISTPAEKVSGGYESVVWAGAGNSRPYALRQHEELKPATPAGHKQMQPGPITEKRPSHPWGPAGGKYLTRPLMYMLKTYTQAMAKKLEAIK